MAHLSDAIWNLRGLPAPVSCFITLAGPKQMNTGEFLASVGQCISEFSDAILSTVKSFRMRSALMSRLLRLRPLKREITSAGREEVTCRIASVQAAPAGMALSCIYHWRFPIPSSPQRADYQHLLGTATHRRFQRALPSARFPDSGFLSQWQTGFIFRRDPGRVARLVWRTYHLTHNDFLGTDSTQSHAIGRVPERHCGRGTRAVHRYRSVPASCSGNTSCGRFFRRVDLRLRAC